jgi:hypothetical protein
MTMKRMSYYLSVGKPRAAVGVDIGDGVVLRYDEETQEVIGLMVIGHEPSLQKPPRAG